MTESQAVGAKRRKLESQHDLLEDVRADRVEESSLADALAAYVERIDTDMVRTSVKECLRIMYFEYFMHKSAGEGEVDTRLSIGFFVHTSYLQAASASL